MIEKLDPIKHTDNLYDRNGFITNVACGGVVIKKVNELIDTVNELQSAKDVMFNRIDMLNNAMCDIRNHIADTSKKVADRMIGCTTLDIPESYKPDPYTEKRKWIGKLCRFKDEDYKDDQWDYGLLQAVVNAETAHVWKAGCFKHNHGHWYDYCEPVKDDIIYKGE